MPRSIYTTPANRAADPTPGGLSPEKAFYFVGRSPLDVLEIGCADMEVGNYLQGLGHEFTGFDLRSNTAQLHGDMNSLPFRQESFHAIVFNATLQYSSNPVETVRELNRVLKPGGFVVGSTAFLEPGIWKSLYHTSPRGLHELLRSGGFSVSHIWPSWNVIDALILALSHDPQFDEKRGELAGLLNAVKFAEEFDAFSRSVQYAGGLNFHAYKN